MEPETTITPDALGEGSQLNPAPAEAAVANEAPKADEALTLAEINRSLGKDFKSKDAALKAFSDTFSYVGKKKEDILREYQTSQNTEALTGEIRQIKQNMFYDKNPDLAEYRPLIEKLGDNPEQVVNSAEFKAIYEKARGYDDSAKLKTVLQSSPRLASSRDNLTKAQEAKNSGNTELAGQLAARAVLESME